MSTDEFGVFYKVKEVSLTRGMDFCIKIINSTKVQNLVARCRNLYINEDNTHWRENYIKKASKERKKAKLYKLSQNL